MRLLCWGTLGAPGEKTSLLTVTGGTKEGQTPAAMCPMAAMWQALPRNGGDAVYYVGEQLIADKAAGTQPGDKLDVKKGDVNLSDVPGGVEVTNSGSGSVTVNGTDVPAGGQVTVCAHAWDAPAWNWAADYSGATANFTCKRMPRTRLWRPVLPAKNVATTRYIRPASHWRELSIPTRRCGGGRHLLCRLPPLPESLTPKQVFDALLSLQYRRPGQRHVNARTYRVWRLMSLKNRQSVSFTVIRKYLTKLSLTLTDRFANGNRELVTFKSGLLSVFLHCYAVESLFKGKGINPLLLVFSCL